MASVQKFFPDIRILVADDTPKEIVKEIDLEKYPNVFQYMMPEYSGWFAGRALAISQVETDFFLWCDDDFIFTEETDLGYLLKVIETSGYDVIGGSINSHEPNTWSSQIKLDIERTSAGNCFNRSTMEQQIPLPKFESGCIVADIVENFFLARTISAGSIRMDPQFRQKAHREWFMDGIGKMRVARYAKKMYIIFF